MSDGSKSSILRTHRIKVRTALSHSYPETIEKFIHAGKDIMKIVRKIVKESQNELGGLYTDLKIYCDPF